jgi:ADP-ribose pyrophosphatase
MFFSAASESLWFALVAATGCVSVLLFSPLQPRTGSPMLSAAGDMESKNPENAVLEHKEIYNGIIAKLHVDTIQLPSGNTAIREVMLHPGGVVAVPVLDDGRLLLIRQFRYPLRKFILELPAGKLDHNLSPRETIALEIEEECGYRAAVIDYQFSFYTSPGISNEIIHFFIARGLTPFKQSLQEGEHITVEAATLEECLGRIESGEIADGKTILGILWYRQKLIVK